MTVAMDMGILSKGGSEIVHRIILSRVVAPQWVSSDRLLLMIVHGMVMPEWLKQLRVDAAMRESIIMWYDWVVRDTGLMHLDERVFNEVTCEPVSEVIALLRFAAVGVFFLLEVRIDVNSVVVVMVVCRVIINCIVVAHKAVVDWHVFNLIHVLHVVMRVRSAYILWVRVIVSAL